MEGWYDLRPSTTSQPHHFRKKSFLICGIVLALAAPCFLLCRTTSSIELLFLGRAIAGSGLGLAIAVLPLYLTELSPLKLRGAVGVLVPIGITAGVVLGQVVGLDQVLGDEDSWQYALSCYALMLVLCFVPYCWLPESPEYLFKVKNDPEGAVEAIRKIFGQHSVGDDYFKCVKVDHVDCEKTKSMSLLAVLKDPSLRLPLVLLCCMSAGNGFSGINAVRLRDSLLLQIFQNEFLQDILLLGIDAGAHRTARQ